MVGASAPNVTGDQAPGQDGLEQLLRMQSEYFGRIKAANAAGDKTMVQALLQELARRSQELQKAPEPVLALVPPVEAPQPLPRVVYDNSVCSLDLPTTVYDGDRDTYLSLVDDASFKSNYDVIMDGATSNGARKELLKTALKLTPTLAPKVYATLDRCRTALGLTAHLEMYVCADVNFNAFCYPPADGKYLIGVTSALLEKFTEDELAFVIGHELGHAIFGHHRLPVGFLLHHDDGGFSPLHAMKMYAWKRNAEITADRVGLLCGRNFDAAASAFFKLSSGVTDPGLAFQLREYINQFADLEAEMADQDVDPEDWYSTHPFSPMRLKALDMFHRSETYARLTGKDGSNAELSEEQLEFQIKKVMSMMEPSYLQESSELGTLMKNFVFNAGYLVAAANGVVDATEIAALGSLLDPREVGGRLAQMEQTNAEAVQAEVKAISEKLNVMLPVVSKLNVIKDLTVIAGADGAVDEAELQVLYAITAGLNIRPEFVDHVLSAAAEGDG